MSEIAQITKSEIEKYKQMFSNKIGPYAVQFDTKEQNGNIVDSFEIYKGESGIDANWTGSIILEKDYFVKWEFSILNGVYIEAKMRMNDNNKNIIGNLYQVFENWRSELSRYLVAPPGEMGQQMPQDSGVEIVSGGLAVVAPEEELASLSESRSTKGRQDIINSSSDRMKRLAGL